MTFLLIVERELRVRARLRSTYRLRLIMATLAFLLVGLLVGMDNPSGRKGQLVFTIMAWLAFVFCLLEGARNTADCLSVEKREGTLGLLFLTDLRSYEIVIGKLLATSLNTFYGLLAIFPPMAISLLLGGVTFAEFWRLVLVLVNTLFFSLTAGLAVSAASRDERMAWSNTLGIVCGAALLPQLLLLYLPLGQTFVAWLGPTAGLRHAMDTAYQTNAELYWSSVLSVNLASWIFLVAATWILPRTWQDRVASPRESLWRRLLRMPSSRQTPQDLERRAMILAGNPAVWLVVRGQQRQTLLWVMVVLAAACSVLAWTLTSGSLGMGIGILGAMFLLHMALAFWVSAQACHLLARARDEGSLELLLSTPLAARDIVEGYYQGLKEMFIRPVAVLFTVEIMLLSAQVYLIGASQDAPWGGCFAILMAVGFVLLSWVLDLVAVARYGLWQGLATRKVSAAVAKTVFYVLIIPLACGFIFTLGLLVPVIGLVKNLVFINYAQEQMRRNFRPLLTGRYGWAEEPEYVKTTPRPRPDHGLPSVLKR